MRYEMYKDHKAEWRWRLRAQNGNVLADSAEGYRHRDDCENGIRLTKGSGDAPVVDMSAKIAAESPTQP
jgi:uncharacterized protein YegP (UPF0339 family)